MANNFILIGANPKKNKSLNPGGQLTASIGLIDYVESLGFGIHVIDTSQSSFPIPPLKARLTKGFYRTKKLLSCFRHKNIDGVIIFSSSGFSFYERILQAAICRSYGVSSILFVRSGHFMNAVNSSIIKRFIAAVLLRAPVLIGAQGKEWISFYESLGIDSRNIVLVRNWLDKDFPVASESRKYNPANVMRFVFVGWLVREKGIPQLLEAVTTLRKEYQFELHLVGDGTLFDYCSRYKASNNLDSTLYLHGWQKKHEVIDILKNSDVFVLPSEAEGFPNALLEAVSLGLPAICTDVGGVSDTLLDNKNGFLLESNRSDLIYNAMKKYLCSPEIISSQSQKSLDIFKANHNAKQNCQVLLSKFLNEDI